MSPIFDEIRASHLAEWARMHETAQWMPSLMVQLVGASGAKVTACRFLTHEETTTAGFDAVVEAKSAGLLVPKGTSAWELSKQQNAAGKVRGDAGKRKRNPGGLAPAKASLVSVTLRVWPSKKRKGRTVSAAANKKLEARRLQRAGGWRAATILDAVDLANALALAPGVGIWLSTVMGRKVHGACSLLSHWEDLASLRKPALPPAVFLAGRDKFTAELEAFMGAAPSHLPIYATSPEDLRDALAAWWKTRATQPTPAKPAVIVQSGDAWEYLRNQAHPLLLILSEEVEATAEQITAAVNHGHHVLSRVPVAMSDQRCHLPTFGRDTLAEALRVHGVDYRQAWRLASDADGSGVVFKRLLAGSAAQPPWARGANAAKLAPAVLVGAWDASLKGDRERVAEIFGLTYAKVEQSLKPHLDSNHPLLRQIGDQWRVVSRADAWHWLSPHLDLAACTRLAEAARQLLTETDPRFALKADERPFAALRGVTSHYSAELRLGLAEGLCLLALQPPPPLKGKATRLAMHTIGRCLPAPGRWQAWATLGGALPLLAEAAPDEFLRAVEADLKVAKPGTVALFGEGGDGVFSQNLWVNLMWALENLVWEPETITRTIDVLTALAARDPGGNTHPRPMGVLESCFAPGLPQCCLSVPERDTLLGRIFKQNAAVGWKLGVALLPRGRQFGSPSHRPKHRRVTEGPLRVTRDEFWNAVRNVIKRLLAAVGLDVAKWSPLIERLHEFPDDVFDLTVEEVKKLGTQLNATARADLRDILQRELIRHEFFAKKAKWVMPPARLAKIAAIVQELQPTDPVLASRWLFAAHHMEMPGTTMDTPHAEQQRVQETLQVEAIKQVLANGGLTELNRLAAMAHYPGVVGDLCARYKLLPAETDRTILPAYLEKPEMALVNFGYGYARARYLLDGWPWFAALKPEGWTPAALGKLSTMFNFEPATWNKFKDFGQAYADEYWRRTHPWAGNLSPTDVDTAVDELLRAGRPEAAIDCVSTARHANTAVSPRAVIAALVAYRDALNALPDPEDGPRRMTDGYRLTELIKFLHTATGLTPEQTNALAGLEWAFLLLLESSHVEAKTLVESMRCNPAIFFQFVEMCHVPDKNVEKKIKVKRSQAESNRAQNAYRLLASIGEVPGANGASVDEAALVAWVTELRRLAAEKDFVNSVEDQIGKLMAAAPSDSAGFWPCAPVARLLSEGGDIMLGAFRAEVFNNQGRHSGFTGFDADPGKERRDAIARLREHAGKLNLEFPIVAGCLRDVAGNLEHFLTEFVENDR